MIKFVYWQSEKGSHETEQDPTVALSACFDTGGFMKKAFARWEGTAAVSLKSKGEKEREKRNHAKRG